MSFIEAEPRLQPQSRFLSLPAELIFATIEHLSNDRRTLCALARTCRLVHSYCEAHIYRTIELRETSDLEAICTAFASRPSRVAAVHKLGILYKHQKRRFGRSTNERTLFNECVSRMTALRDWHIESPFDNFKWGEPDSVEWVEKDMETFRQCLEKASLCQGRGLQQDVGLSKLETLVIHSHGTESDYWEVTGFDSLFRHPTLRHLHVSCIRLPSDMPQLESHVASTPLSTLIFDECDLEVASLERILSTPKRLKNLTLGENVFNIKIGRLPSPKISTVPAAAVKALMPVAHSLETLVHIDPMFLTHADPTRPPAIRIEGEGMRNFFNLKSIDCDPCSFLHQGIIASRVQAPPNLESLRVRYYHRHYQNEHNLFDELPDINSYAQLPSLKLLEYIQPAITPRSAFYASQMADSICEENRLRERHAYAYRLWKRGVQMKVYAEMHRKYTLIPPYLHTEPRPELLLLYDSDAVGFYRDPSDPTIAFEDWLDESEISEEQKEVPETDQLGAKHLVQLRNEVRRAIRRYIGGVRIRDHSDEMSDDFDSDSDSNDESIDSSELDTDSDEDVDIEIDEDEDEDDMDDDDLDLDLAEEGLEIDAEFLEYLLGEAEDELGDVYEDADEFLASGMTIDELLDPDMGLDAEHQHEGNVGGGSAEATDAEDYVDAESEMDEDDMSGVEDTTTDLD
ncbi:hypothetical protein K491DRAFT_771004 [Lophiostoma macrostomum CBS 122681]|uniref:F-box domain-containing protein n=1 Tax=Lophiostoma macrostomum CBS 122681 TaxID=1314788 RepID=A0A6A6SSI0_9PLEO|nr:hypothetical protein K491DRAFT_771004 [Lophiostoma macrostomum CBS 122681]